MELRFTHPLGDLDSPDPGVSAPAEATLLPEERGVAELPGPAAKGPYQHLDMAVDNPRDVILLATIGSIAIGLLAGVLLGRMSVTSPLHGGKRRR